MIDLNQTQKLPWVTPALRKLPANHQSVQEMLAAQDCFGERKKKASTR